MSDKNELTIERVFELMDGWRHLPDYQLERRADIFFALFLPEVLRERFDFHQDLVLVPEFPIKNPNGKLSRVDYLALQKPQLGEPERAFLIELKTDMSSIGEDQKDLLKCAAKRGLRSLVDDVISILQPPKEKRKDQPRQTRQKYVHLLHHLRDADLVRYNESELYEKVFVGDRGVYESLENVSPASWVRHDKPKLEVVYVQPDYKNEPDFQVVDFEMFAGIVQKGRGDKHLRLVFANYLRKWALKKAGSPNPRTL